MGESKHDIFSTWLNAQYPKKLIRVKIVGGVVVADVFLSL